MSLTEFEIIKNYFDKKQSGQYTIKGIGDDCAVLNIPAEKRLVLSMDTVVAGRHFPQNAKPHQIATRAFCTALSDLAAMGAQPQWFTLGLTLPEANEEWLQSFSNALLKISEQYHCELVGGDTTQGPLAITIQVHGFVDKDNYLSRSGAKIGDYVYVTGALGDGAAALAMLQSQQIFTDDVQHYLTERFYQPEPQIQAGLQLVDIANAAIDISDGLLADLQHIANASQVDIQLQADALPFSSACQSVNKDLAEKWVLTGGDDYQLAFTVPQKSFSLLEQKIQQGLVSATKIGAVCAMQTDQPQIIGSNAAYKGYQHFTS